MLILRHGIIHTMTGKSPVQADMLIRGGRIMEVASALDPAVIPATDEPVQELDLTGCHVLPGLIDPHMRLVSCAQPDDYAQRLRAAAACEGITTMVLTHTADTPCALFTDARLPHAPVIYALSLQDIAEPELCARLARAQEQNAIVIADVFGPDQLSLLLCCHQSHPARLILSHLCGCENMADTIADTGLGVILGACSIRRPRSAYTFAAALQAAGVPVALTTDYPSTRLHHLPLCAELCMRAGMPAEAALQAITAVPARLLGLSDELGTIASGMQADLVVFDGEPLQLLSSVKQVIRCGAIC